MRDQTSDECDEGLGIWDGSFIPAEHWHFHRRVLERYLVVLPPGSFSKMLRRLQAGPSKNALQIGRNVLTGREVWGLYIPDGKAGRLFYVVWLPRKQAVITALPPSAKLHAKFRRAKEEWKEDRQRRRLPVPLSPRRLLAFLPRVSGSLGRWSAASPSLRSAQDAGNDVPTLRTDSSRPFFAFEVVVKRDRQISCAVPNGQGATWLRETIFQLRAIFFRAAP